MRLKLTRHFLLMGFLAVTALLTTTACSDNDDIEKGNPITSVKVSPDPLKLVKDDEAKILEYTISPADGDYEKLTIYYESKFVNVRVIEDGKIEVKAVLDGYTLLILDFDDGKVTKVVDAIIGIIGPDGEKHFPDGCVKPTAEDVMGQDKIVVVNL